MSPLRLTAYAATETLCAAAVRACLLSKIFLKRLCLFTFTYLTVTDCRLLPVTKSTARQAFEKKHAQILPQDFMKNGRSLFESITIPNSDFCSDMILRPEDHYLVLPWWYHYCQDLKEKHTKGIKGNVNYDVVHKYILSELQLLKKRVNQKNIKMSELEQELVVANNAM